MNEECQKMSSLDELDSLLIHLVSYNVQIIDSGFVFNRKIFLDNRVRTDFDITK